MGKLNEYGNEKPNAKFTQASKDLAENGNMYDWNANIVYLARAAKEADGFDGSALSKALLTAKKEIEKIITELY